MLSGGLDSILAAKILRNQGIKTTALSFESYFFNAKQAKKAAQNLKIPIKIIDFSKEHLEMVKNPRHGYGSSMNPCIDCHILMLRTAKRFAKLTRNRNAKQTRKKFYFVATGEVLGQRPMSQNKNALNLIEKESGLRGYLLRPLSAKLLEPTVAEKEGLIDRKKLFDISGRSRKRQIALAKKWRIRSYPTPAGGCLLTEAEFGKKLKDLFKECPNCGKNDIELLKVGRHFWFFGAKIIVGRNEKENTKIQKLARENDILVELKKYPGPTTLIRHYKMKKNSLSVLGKAKYLTQFYSVKIRDKKNIGFNILHK